MIPLQHELPKGLSKIEGIPGGLASRCDMLDEITLLQGMPYDDLMLISEHLIACAAPSGVYLLREGEQGETMFFLVDGELAIRKECAQGEERLLTTIRTGKTVGEMSLIDQYPHSASVMTSSPVRLLLLTRAGLESLRKAHPRVAYDLLQAITRLLSFRLRQTSGKLIDHI